MEPAKSLPRAARAISRAKHPPEPPEEPPVVWLEEKGLIAFPVI
jgi:hypothetical protein